MISKLNIEGFKGINELEIPKLSRVTLLGGRNNVGKSSILEALFMFHDRLNPHMILRQFAGRGVGTITIDPESMWTPIFHNYDSQKAITISAIVDGEEEEMVIKFNRNYVPAPIPENLVRPGIKPMQIRTDQKREPQYSLDIVYNDASMKDQRTHLLMGINGPSLQIDNAEMKKRLAILLGARMLVNPEEDAQRFGQLDIINKQEEIVEFLQIIEPKLKSLSSVAIGNISLIHGDIGLSKKIPVAYMGDGVSRSLSIILAIATSRNGIVMIDECENGIYHSIMPKIWEAITKAAREYNCQVIGTTHSYECLEAASNGISGDLRNDFSYIRIDKTDDKTTAKCFDYEMLRVAIETNMEVR